VVGAFAPAAPALAETVVAMGLFLAFIVAWGLLTVYRSTLGAIALAIADRIEGVGISTRIGSIHPLGPLADAIRWADAQIDNGLGFAVRNTQRGGTILFQLVTRQLRAIGDTIGGFAYDVSAALHRIDTVTIPNVTHSVYVRLHGEIVDWRGYTRRNLRRLDREVAAVGAIAAATLGQLGWMRTRVRRIEGLLAPAVFAGLVGKSLNKLGLRWIRCPSLNRIERRHGCAPWRLLELLLATTVPALVLGNVCQLVKYAEAGAVAVEPSLSKLVATGENFVCGGDTDGPSGIIAADRHDSTHNPSGWLAADLVGSSV
jgi:hypothetical protein